MIITRAIFRLGNRSWHRWREHHKLETADASASKRLGKDSKPPATCCGLLAPPTAQLLYGGTWFVNVLINVGMAWMVIAYGVCFGNGKTNDLFFTWGYGGRRDPNSPHPHTRS